MRLQGSFGTYWIDAICINQASFEERNHQVKLMRQVYSNAQSVSIWLGECEAESPMDVVMDKIANSQFASYKNISGPTEQDTEAMRALCDDKYWRRMWVIQEVVLARQPIIHYGSKTVNFDVVAHVFIDVFSNSFCRTPIWNIASTRRDSRSESLSLKTLISDFQNHEATVIHDKVYALLGLASRGNQSLDVDYQSSTTELFSQVFTHTHPDPPKDKEDLEHFMLFGQILADVLELEYAEVAMFHRVANNDERKQPMWTDGDATPPLRFINNR
ncbi:protein phosphatase regulator [Neodidymelliopsis sp. IMI 364377]|nr:protein phosphatase regulator [Neodidymelliopsis sp. IMI 364377]